MKYGTRRQMVAIAFSALVFQASAVAEPSAPPHLAPGEPYSLVREKMIASGWTPFHAEDADPCSEYDERCAGRPEMVHCAGTGLGPCKFLWRKEGKIVALCTIGEDAPELTGLCTWP